MNVNESLFVMVACSKCKVKYVLWKGVSLDEITDWMWRNTVCSFGGPCKLGRAQLD